MADERGQGSLDNIYRDAYRRDGRDVNVNDNTTVWDMSDGNTSVVEPSVNFPNVRYQFADWLDVAESSERDAVIGDLSDEDTLHGLCDEVRGYDMGAIVVDGHEEDEGVRCLNFMLEHGEVWDLLMERFGDDEAVRGLNDAVRGDGGGFEVAVSYFKSHPTALDDLMADDVYGKRFREAGLGSVAYDELLRERSDIEERIVGDDRGISAREYGEVLRSVDANVAPRVAMSETEVPTWLFLAVDQSGDPSLRHSYGVTNMQGQAEGRLGIPCGLFVARMRHDPSTGEMVPDIERVKTMSQIYVVPTGTEEGGADIYVVDPNLALTGDEASMGSGSDKKVSRIFSALCAHKDAYGDMLHAVDDGDEVFVVNPDDPSEVYRSVPAVRFCLGESSMRAMPVVDPGDLTGEEGKSRLRDYDPFNVRIRDLAKMSQGSFVDGAFDYRSDGSPESYLYEWMVFGDDGDDYGDGYGDDEDVYDGFYGDEQAPVPDDVVTGEGPVPSAPYPMGQGVYGDGMPADFGGQGQGYPPQQGQAMQYQQQGQSQGQFVQQPAPQPSQQPPQQPFGPSQGAPGQPSGPQQPMGPSGAPPVTNGVGWDGPDAGMYGDEYDDYGDEYDEYDDYDDEYDGYDDDGDAYGGQDVPGSTQPMPQVGSADGARPDAGAPDVVVSGTRPDGGDGYRYVSAIGPSSYAPELQDFEELLRAARSGEDVKSAMMLNIGHLSSKIETFSTKDIGAMRAVRESRIEGSHDRRPVALTHAGSSFAHAFGESFMAEQPGFVRRLAGRLSRAMQRAGRVGAEDDREAVDSVRDDASRDVVDDEPIVDEGVVVDGTDVEATATDGPGPGAVDGTSAGEPDPVVCEPSVQEPVVGTGSVDGWQGADVPEGDFYERYDPGYFYGDGEISPDAFEEAYAEYEAMQGYVDDVDEPGDQGSPVVGSEVVADPGHGDGVSVDEAQEDLPDLTLAFDGSDGGAYVYDDFSGYADDGFVEGDDVTDIYERVPPVFDGGEDDVVEVPDDQRQP